MLTAEQVFGGLAIAANKSDWPNLGPSLVTRIRDLQGVPDPVKTILEEMTCGILEAHLNFACMYLATGPFQMATPEYLIELMMKIKALRCGAEGGDSVTQRFETFKAVHRAIEAAYDGALVSGSSPNIEELFDSVSAALPPG